MKKKSLVNNVSLNIGEEISSIDIQLSVPISINEEDKKKLKDKENINLGAINFSDKTSILIRQLSDNMSRELLLKIQ